MSYDAGKIVATADLDRTPFQQGLRLVRSEGDDLGRQTYTPKVELRGVGEAEAKVAALNAELDKLDRRTATVGTRGGGFGGGGSSVGSRRGGFGQNLPNPSWMALGIGAALPLAGPLAGAALGGAASFLTPSLAGAVGLAGFGAAAKSSVTTITGDITKLNKLTAQYDAATTNKQRAAVLTKEAALWKALDPAQRQAVKNVQGLDKAWASYKKHLEPQTFGAVAGGAKLGETGLGLLLPSAKAAGNTIISLERQAEKALQSPFFKEFFGTFLSRETAHAVDTLGVTFGHLGDGFAHLAVAFAPLGHDLERGMVNLSAQFDKWTQGSGPVRFVAWVEKEGPVVGKTLLALVNGIEGLGKGLAPIGELEFKALEPVLNFIGDLGKQHPEVITALGSALLVVGGGLKAIKAAGTVSSVLGRGGIGGGKGVVGDVLGSRGASPANPLYVFVVDKAPGGGGGVVKTIGKAAIARGAIGAAAEFGLPGGAALAALAFTPVPKQAQFDTAQNARNIDTFRNDKAVQQRYAQRLAQAQSANPGMPLAELQPKALTQAIADVHGYDRAVQGAVTDLDKLFSGLPNQLHRYAALGLTDGTNLGAQFASGVALGMGRMKAQTVKAAHDLGVATWQSTAKALEVSSPSRKGIWLGQMLAQGLVVGFTGASGSVLKAFTSSTDKVLMTLGTQMTAEVGKYQSDIASRLSFRQGLQSSLAGAGDIAGATVFGGNSGPRGGVRGYLTAQAGGLRTLAVSLGKLAKLGLSPILLAQIANAGPQQGVLLAQEILSGTDGSIKSLNRLEGSIQTYANTAAGTVANAQFSRTLAHDLASIATLAKSVEHLASKSGRWNAADMHTFASVLAQELSRILKIPLSDIDKALGIRSWTGS